MCDSLYVTQAVPARLPGAGVKVDDIEIGSSEDSKSEAVGGSMSESRSGELRKTEVAGGTICNSLSMESGREEWGEDGGSGDEEGSGLSCSDTRSRVGAGDVASVLARRLERLGARTRSKRMAVTVWTMKRCIYAQVNVSICHTEVKNTNICVQKEKKFIVCVRM